MFRFVLVFTIMLLGVQVGLCAEVNLTHYSQEELEAIGSRVAPNGKSYNFPSIMIQSDFTNSVDVGNKHFRSLLLTLMVNGWVAVLDQQGRQIKYVSPEITYKELKGLLNFYDDDVSNIKNRKQNGPHSLIVNERNNCEITYVNEIYDGKNDDLKLTAVVYNNKEHAESINEWHYDEDKNLFENAKDFYKILFEDSEVNEE